MNFGFGKDQDVTASAVLIFAAPKIRRSRKTARNGRGVDGLRFNLRDSKTTSGGVFPAESALPDRALPRPVSAQEASKPSGILFERQLASNLDAIPVETVEDTVILATSGASIALLQALSPRKASKQPRYALICHENRGNRAVPAVASTAGYVAKNAAQSPELDVNQAMVPPEKHGVVSAFALARRRR